MAERFYQKYLYQVLKFRQEHPLIFLSSSICLVFIIYYLIVLMPLSQVIAQGQDDLKHSVADFQWMARASHEITRLKKLTPHDKQKLTETPFAYVNQQVNDQAWSGMVTDVRQMDQDQVQISFKSIPYTILATWLQEIYRTSGIFVAEATLERVEPGIVDATFVLRSHGAEGNDAKN